ncbi:hypothetical protein NON00_17365 [Roseomonas sp. GC11]|uniref:hypothetical protein n=1 Tax=Roseomonas sp. GC11 TaxID=2950546 RepID=UPI00210E1185|nr:hypothetical protein [Roseomonas sp. GC11]MCQ4161686.1 hypothetical protein [Roseomonas sp. GC11]
MAWHRLGLIYQPTGPHPLLVSHAALPVGVPLGGDLVRVYFSGRDARNRSSIGTLVLRLGDPPRIEEEAAAPVLAPGGLGTFDDAGLGLGCILPGPDGEGDRLYYMGWNIGGSVPWRNAIGLALGDARQGRFTRFSEGPLMDRDRVDVFSLSYPWVLPEGAGWRMWYGTHLAWGAATADMSHALRTAWSADGLHWERQREPVLAPEGEEIAVVRPCVEARPGGGYRMLFAARGHGPYRIAEAVSGDGLRWQRVPGGGLPPRAPWEEGATTYPSVFHQGGRRWLLYNGAGHGRAGIGLAVEEP